MTLSSLLLASLLVAPPRHPHPHHHAALPHLIRPPFPAPALHKHFGWVVVRTKTWRGRVYVDLGLVKRAEWIFEMNGR